MSKGYMEKIADILQVNFNKPFNVLDLKGRYYGTFIITEEYLTDKNRGVTYYDVLQELLNGQLVVEKTNKNLKYFHVLFVVVK